MRRALFGRHGRKVIGGLCGYELLALVPGSPVPTLSSIVERKRVVGLALLLMLGHHFFVEQHQLVPVPLPGGAFGPDTGSLLRSIPSP